MEEWCFIRGAPVVRRIVQMRGKKKHSLKDKHYYMIKILSLSDITYDNIVVRYEGVVDGLPMFTLTSSEDAAPVGQIKSFKIIKELDLIR